MRAILIFILGLLIFTQAHARRPEKVRIQWTESTNEMGCGLTRSGIQAAAESALRRNGFVLSHLTDHHAMMVDVGVTSIGQLSSSDTCAATVSLSFSFPIAATASWGGTYRFRTVRICEQTVLLTGPSINMQRRIREKVSEYVDVCVSEEERSRDR